MPIQLYNTLSRQKEPFETIEPGVVRMYVCGVTVYDSAHVGHAMSSIVFDTIRRYLMHRGFTVRYVQNFTDVDDKIIAKSVKEGVSAFEIADRYAREFLVEQNRLGLLAADLYPRVSSEMPSIIGLIQTLVDKGHAYPASNGDVYFDVKSFPTYGQLSRRPLEDAVSEEPSADKRDALDFALWKSAKPGEPWWESPWGNGRPGWHIECSAMAMKHLGEKIDIHGGGLDLVFPHHENEIAQSEAACDCAPFSRYWLHNGMLQLGEEKMSKSLGNIVRIADFLDAHDPEAMRLFVLSSHYRGSLTLSDESIAAAEKGLERLRGALRSAHPGASGSTGDIQSALAAAVKTADQTFHDAMDDDFGTPGALAALFALVTEINRARDAGATAEVLTPAQDALSDLAGVLGFNLRSGAESAGGADLDASPFIELLVEVRNEARAAKNWALSDHIRDRLGAMGVLLEDVAGGTSWRRG